MKPLAVVIPALQEARRLPLLLADLAAAPPGLIAECLVVDGGSADGSAALAQAAGATSLHSPAGRGLQLQRGVAASTAPWLLLLHADARLSPGWAAAVQGAILEDESEPAPAAWYFDLAVEGSGLALRVLERAVAWRSRWRRLPYGDQGLLLPRQLLEAAGGIAPLPLMEDLDLMLRLRRLATIRALGLPLRVDGRRWQRLGVLGTARRNAALRRAWRRGDHPDALAERYYNARA
ncbi:MAG: TIGR04283 family arsenosugar biosynthesis glycosyltransferase [Vulcanococcus sp.]